MAETKKVSNKKETKVIPLNTETKNSEEKVSVKPEDVIAEDKKVVEEFSKNPENRKKAVERAFQIQQELPHWFAVEKIVKKFKVDLPEAARQIEILMLMNMCVARMEKGKALFKIDLDHKEQRRLILESIEQKKGEILFLEEKLVKLN